MEVLSMLRRRLLHIAGWTAAAGFLLACYYSHPLVVKSPPAGPKSLQEVTQIASSLGLHHRSDIASGELTIRLIVSARPLTFERANSMHFDNPSHPCWQDTVAVSAPWRQYLYLAHPDHGVVWGDVFIYGDPALIRTLTAAAPAGRPAR
jgi:hypothetical protein